MRLIDIRTADGSRQFVRLPKTADWAALCDHTLRLPDARIGTAAVSLGSGGWFDFTCRGHHFTVTAEGETYGIAVSDPQCPDAILFQVAVPFAIRLGAR